MDRTLTLIEKAHQGDKAARDLLVEENMGLVWSIVRRFKNRGVEMEDLFQIGSIGLLKAIDKFDTGYEVRFSTYAVPMISGEIKRFLRDDGMIKVSRSMKETACRAYQTREMLERQQGRSPRLRRLPPPWMRQRKSLSWRWRREARWNPCRKPFIRGRVQISR